MADAATGFERGIETTGYSPVVTSDRGTTDRIIRSPAPLGDAHDSPHSDLAAANTAVRVGDPIINQPSPVGMGNQGSNFGFEEQAPTGPQRARLIGELPTPRVPSQISDVEGEVRVRFTVDTEGRPVTSTLSVQTSPNPLLTAAVRKVIPGIRFEPARSGGSDSKPINDSVEIGFRFAGQSPIVSH